MHKYLFLEQIPVSENKIGEPIRKKFVDEIFYYYDSNINLFSFAPCKVIARLQPDTKNEAKILRITNIAIIKQDNVFFGWGATLSCFKQDFNVIISFFTSLYNIFHMKDLKRFTFYVKLIDDRRKT